MTKQDHEWPDVRAAGDGAASGVAAAAVQDADTASTAWPENRGPGFIQVRTTFPLFVSSWLILVKTRITVDMRCHTLPWGISSFAVAPGTHDLRVSHNWIWAGGGGRAVAAVHVRAGETVRLRYRPSALLVFLAGKLTVEETTYGHHQIEPVEFAQDPRTRGRWRIAVLAVAAICTIVAALIGARVGEWAVSDGSGSDGWATVRAQDMSISLPRSFEVTTDPADYVEALAAVGASEPDQLAELIEQFPDVFALAAFQQQSGDGAGAVATVEVLRFPAADEPLDEFAESFGEGLEAGGQFEITGESERAVGRGRYAAVRIDFDGSWPGQPTARSVAYLVDGGSLQWVVAFTAPSEEYDTVSRTFDRSIATLTLPTADDDEEGGDGQR